MVAKLDRDRLTALVEPHWRQLYNFVFRLTLDRDRAAFVVCHILKLSDDAASKSLGITESAYKVRLSRARKKVGDYLAPRCEHVNPMNPCRCPARVGTALHKGFIRPMGEVSLRK